MERSKVFVMENVSGLVKGRMKLVFADIMRELKASGYKVRCKLLNAMYFYVPQSRQRLIWIGVREDLAKEASFPRAESRAIDANLLLPQHLQDKRFLSWRNKGGSKKDDLKRRGSVPVGITQKGVDLEGRVVYSDSRGVQLFQSFPPPFSFTGQNVNALQCIGNSVPPLFMRAIARHIRKQSYFT